MRNKRTDAASADAGTTATDSLGILSDIIEGRIAPPCAGQIVPPPPGPGPDRRLGALSETHESGGRGPGTVSTGLRDPGGASYGTYQLASRTGTVAAFLGAEGVRWSRDFFGRLPGSAEFNAAWKAVAARDPAAFADAQHAFIERTHYRPVVAAVKSRTGLDLDGRADAVRDAIWSCAVQHGRAAVVVCRGVTEADRIGPRHAARYDRDLLEAIYAARCDYVRKVAGTASGGERKTLLDIVSRRFPAELRDALAMLGQQNDRTTRAY